HLTGKGVLARLAETLAQFLVGKEVGAKQLAVRFEVRRIGSQLQEVEFDLLLTAASAPVRRRSNSTSWSCEPIRRTSKRTASCLAPTSLPTRNCARVSARRASTPLPVR